MRNVVRPESSRTAPNSSSRSKKRRLAQRDSVVPGAEAGIPIPARPLLADLSSRAPARSAANGCHSSGRASHDSPETRISPLCPTDTAEDPAVFPYAATSMHSRPARGRLEKSAGHAQRSQTGNLNGRNRRFPRIVTLTAPNARLYKCRRPPSFRRHRNAWPQGRLSTQTDRFKAAAASLRGATTAEH